MKITVSREQKHKPKHTNVPSGYGYKQTCAALDKAFADIGYRCFRANDSVTCKSEYSDMPELRFNNIYEAKGWLIQAGAWKD